MASDEIINRPVLRTRSAPSLIWLIPLATLLIGGWLVVKTIAERGPEVTISFRTADGIEAGKTTVKYKNVDVGIVESIRFSDDLRNVLVSARFNHATEHLLRRDTRFWVVRPQLSLRGAHGLSTLLTGAYIEIDPGPGAPQQHFIGLEQRPLITTDEAGRRITLISDRLASLDAGSPIYYQGILVGEVLGYELGSDRSTIHIPAFIRAPYDQLVRGNSRFWNVGGLEFGVGADGPQLKLESLLALLYGGIAFDTPPPLEPPADNLEELVFRLHPDRQSITTLAYTHKVSLLLHFDGSVRGLNIGAPVEFMGIRIGQVAEIRLQVDPDAVDFRIPVRIEIEPERFLDPSLAEAPLEELLPDLIERGLRARLRTASLLTGQLFIELGMLPESELVLRGGDDPAYPELPTVGGGLDSILASVDRFAGQLDEVDIASIARNLDTTLAATGSLLDSPELAHALGHLQGLLRQLDESNLDQAIDTAQAVLTQIERQLQPSAPLHYNLVRATAELEETARALRALLELLERRPQSLLFGPQREAP